MEDLKKMSISDLEKIFFDSFGVAVHEAGTYSKERLVFGILASRGLQNEGNLSSVNKSIKKIPKLPFTKGHFHYPVCKLDTEESYKEEDCDCSSKMDTHSAKLKAMAAGSKSKKPLLQANKKNETQVNKVEAVVKVDQDAKKIEKKTEVVLALDSANQQDDPTDVNKFPYLPYNAAYYDSNVVKHIVKLAMPDIAVSQSSDSSFDRIIGWFNRNVNNYKANRAGCNYQVKIQFKEKKGSMFFLHVHFHREKEDEGKVTIISLKSEHVSKITESSNSVTPPPQIKQNPENKKDSKKDSKKDNKKDSKKGKKKVKKKKKNTKSNKGNKKKKK